MPPAATPKDFLEALWGSQKGVAELTAITTKSATKDHPRSSTIKAFGFGYPDSIDSLLGAAANHNEKGSDVYMGVCLRQRQWEIGKRGTEDLALSSNVIWLDIDFAEDGHKGKTIQKQKAHQMLSQFKIQPSIIVKTGGGVHVYWLLKEPALGAELRTVKLVNKALAKYFEADPSSTDLARILRIPGHVNHKYHPPRPVELLLWKPERACTLLDFDFLPIDEEPRFALVPPVGPAPSPQAPTAGNPAPLPAPSGQDTYEPRVHPNLQIPEDHVHKVGELLSQIWSEGFRHQIALHVAGWFVNHQIVMDSTKRVVAVASDFKNGDTPKRLKDVEDTYRNFTIGKEVTGRTSLEKMIDSWDMEAARTAGRKALRDIEKLLPRPPRKKKDQKPVDANFTIPKIIKFDSRPARYQTTIKKHERDGTEKDYVVDCEFEVLTDIKMFRKHFFQASLNQFINPIAQSLWEDMVSKAPMEVKPAPAEATTGGSILAALETWAEEKREKPQLGELKTFMGYNEKELYFTLEALKGRLRDRQIKVTDREITHVLKDGGWQDDRRWIGSKNPRLWCKPISSGNGHAGNGKAHVPPPSDLFLGEADELRAAPDPSLPSPFVGTSEVGLE